MGNYVQQQQVPGVRRLGIGIKCVYLLAINVNEVQLLDPFVPNWALQQVTLEVEDNLKVTLLRQLCLRHADNALLQ